MQTEIEAKFLNIKHDDIRARLKELGAEIVEPMHMMRRRNFDYPDRRLDKKGAWIRLRDEGEKVELMLKQSVGNKLGDVTETPVLVNDFEAATDFLLAIGMELKMGQETKRELWRMGRIEIMLDEWPWVDTFIEIEAENEQALRSFVEKLGLDWNKAIFDTVEPVYYNEYDISRDDIHAVKSMRFSDPVPPNWKRK